MTRRGEGLVVLGAGLAGLSAAYHAGPGARVFERDGRVGGECVTDVVRGYHFDRSGHLLHLRTPEAKRLVARLLPDCFRRVARDARIHLRDRDVRYPFQANLYGLSQEMKAQGLRDYLEAVTTPSRPPRNFSEWTRASFGATVAGMFFEPYNRKLWTVEPKALTLEWMGGYVPKPDLPTVIRGAFADVPGGGGYNASFLYPKGGGIEVLARALAAHAPGLALNAEAVRVDPRRRTADIRGIGRVAWKRLISTLPLPSLVARLEQPPERVREAARRLQSNSVLVVNLGVRRARLHPAHWLYFPEPEYVFYRVGFPTNFGRVAPAGRSALYAEVALPAGTGWDRRRALAARVRRDLRRAGLLRPDDVVEAEQLQYIPYAYVIFDREHRAARKTIMDYLERCGIQSVGRWGGWEYSAMEDALLAGARAAARRA